MNISKLFVEESENIAVESGSTFSTFNSNEIPNTNGDSFNRKVSMFFIFILILSFAFFSRMIYLSFISPTDYSSLIEQFESRKLVPQQTEQKINPILKSHIIECLEKDYQFDDIKFFYENLKFDPSGMHSYDKSQLSAYNSDLLKTLQEIADDYFKSGDQNLEYISKVRLFIEDAKYKYPFDILPETQRKLFIDLQEKAGKHYQLISNDLILIANELNRKNELISSNNWKTNFSLIIGVLAFFAGFFPIFKEIYLENKKRKNEQSVSIQN